MCMENVGFILPVVLLAGSAFAAVVENGALRVELDETSGSLTVVDKRTSRTWKSIADDHPIVVSDVQAVGSRITFKGTADSVKGSLVGEVSLDGEKVLCSLDAPETVTFALGDKNLVGWPAGFVAEKGDRFLIPHGSGFSFPAEETNLGERFDARMHGYSREWRMGLWAQYAERLAADGEILGAGGYMAVVETPCNTVGFHLKRANGLLGFSCLWESDLGTWGHARSIRFEFLEECSPMTVALRYREEMKRKGYYKTFAEKAKERPKMAENFRRLAGAPSVWYWAIDGDKAGVCRYLRETCGFRDFMFQFAKRKDLGVWVTPEEVKACAETAPGVLLSEYDIYKDTMEKKYLPLIEYVRPYWSLEAADNDDIVYDAAGRAVRGWKVALKGDFDGFGKGLGCATVCERTIAKYVRKRMTEELTKYPWYTGRYLDATGCFEPFECYNPKHRMSRRDCVRDRREMMAIPGDEYGLLSSTEDGQDFLASVCDYFACGFSAANDYRVDGGRWMWKIYDGEPPDEIRRGTDEKTRMPIFEMVYHGCCVSYWDWCDYNFKFPKIWWKRDLFNALCGTPPLYFFNEETWLRFRDRLKASYDVTTPIARATYSTPMKRYRILTPDRSVQRVEFENGVASTVNFGEKPFTMKDGFVLAPHGHRFEFAGTSAAPEPNFRLRDGDHLVFCGDSITCHSWTRENGSHHLITNALARSGRAKGVTVTGLGFCGNTVRDWIGREKGTRGSGGKTQMSNRHGDRFPPQDVKKTLDGKVDVVVILLGMNDILMPAVGPTGRDRAEWARDYARLASNLWTRTSARTLVLGTFTPLTADPDGPKNRARQEMNQHIRRIAAEMGACVWDAGVAAEAVIDETRRCDPAFREAPDFVHPGDLGHLAMAASFCRAVGEDAAAADLDARREAQMRERFPLKPSVSYRLHPRSLEAPDSERLAYDLSWNVRGLKDPRLTFEVPDGWDCTPKTARGVSGEVRLVGRPDRWRNVVRITAAAGGSKAIAEVPVATPWCVSDGFDFAAAWKGMDWRTNAIPPVSAEMARWTRLVAGTWDYLGRCESGSVDLYQAWFGGRTDSVYVRRRIVSEKRREVGFVIGTESFSSTLGFVVKLNGRDVWRGTLPRGMKRLAPETKLPLCAGDNELVIRVDHNQWQRQFSFDLVPDGDDDLEDLRFDWRPLSAEAENVLNVRCWTADDYFNEAVAAYSSSTNVETSIIARRRVQKADSNDCPRVEVPAGDTKRIRWIGAPGLRNVRDIGGWTGLRAGRVYRGSALMWAEQSNVAYAVESPVTRDVLVNRLGIRSELDLRGEKERKVTKDGVPRHGLPEFGIRPVCVPLGNYMDAFKGTNAYRRAMRAFADPANFPIYVHCAGGADRTGTVIFLLEALCGVPEWQMDIDYEITSMAGVFGRRDRTDTGTLCYKTFKDALKTRYAGTTVNEKVEDYCRRTLGLTDDEIRSIRRNLR